MRIILTAVVSLGLYSTILACDVCGCSVGGNYFGILPQFHRHFIGIRHQYREFQSVHPALFADEPALVSQEYYHTTELWGRFVPHRRIQIFGFVPYNNYSKTENGIMQSVSGLGDASLMVHFVLFNSGDSLKRAWKHALQAGGGIKLPLGESNRLQTDGTIIPNLQAGTGAFDVPLSLIYTTRYKRWGMNAELSYRFNGTNERAYHFGNRMSSALRFFYWQNLRRLSVLPNLGATFEYARRDRVNDLPQEFTGGQSLMLSAGVDVYYNRCSMGFSARQPAVQNLGDGQIKSRTQVAAHFIYLF